MAPIPVGTVTVTPESMVLVIATSAPFTVEVRDRDGQLLTGRKVEWTSGDTMVVAITQQGIATAVGLGVTRIAATCDGVSGGATVYASYICPCSPPSGATGQGAPAPSACGCGPR